MDSFEFNKLIGALLGVVFVLFSVSLIGDAFFHAPAPEKPGFIIEAAEDDASHGGAAEAPVEVPIGTLMASADAAKGEAVFKKCVTCHTADKGGANKTGPNLWDIVNRPIASHEGFSYSAAMKNFSEGGSVVWDFDHLNHFLRAPRAYIKGTAMGFAGDKKDDERADLIAYLRSLSDSPAALPEPAAPAAGGTAEPAAEGTAPAAEGAAPAVEGAAPAPENAAPAAETAPAESPAAQEAPKTVEPAPAQ
ncbi:c-type cytochrome [Mesorhizobium sp. NBSH29]|uniref:c-type cytochrome n=1 Tax=Mesorhizobium sp. NBSH29 TaxID=2654249 RepID=UPI0018968033|nr:cytochrome c family protein [Mesorhizobium sp. NBSH29]QPC86568.1 c-type cytochrome [Mesorhizobium sp. NBSH29]